MFDVTGHDFLTSGSGRRRGWPRPYGACLRGALRSRPDRRMRPSAHRRASRPWSGRGGRARSAPASASPARCGARRGCRRAPGRWRRRRAVASPRRQASRCAAPGRTRRSPDGPAWLFHAVQRVVDDALRGALLAVEHHLVDEHLQRLAVVLAVTGQCRAARLCRVSCHG